MVARVPAVVSSAEEKIDEPQGTLRIIGCRTTDRCRRRVVVSRGRDDDRGQCDRGRRPDTCIDSERNSEIPLTRLAPAR